MAQIILDSNNNLIQGDFDNATLNNRTKLQTTTTNATTNVYVVPNGSSTSAGVSVANNSNLTNASKIVMATNGTTDTQIISGINGTGTYLPLSFYTNNTLAMQIDNSQNVGIGATSTAGGSVSNTSNLYAGKFKTVDGSATISNGGTIDLFTIPGNSVFIVTIQTQNASGLSAVAIMSYTNGGNPVVKTSLAQDNAGFTITFSGTTIRATNTLGGPIVAQFSAIRLL